MSGPLGLSIGTANLVAARAGEAPVTRGSVLTLFGHRPPEVGTPEENPGLDEPGLPLRGFVERVGDPDPVVAADGSAHPGDALTAAALDGMARAVGCGAPVAVAVPGHWVEHQVGALRAAVRSCPALTPDTEPPVFICDGTAALAALYAQPGFPDDGVVALCDFGASGTSITLADAAANFRQIAPTVRYTGFSGDQLDQTILRHVASGPGADATGTAPLAPLDRRLAQCRIAKEQLSSATVTVIPADLPGIGADFRLARGEFETLISTPLQRFVECIVEVLRRNGIPPGRLAAIATVGGGACIPLITSRLSERLEAPVVTTPQPGLSAAIGAAVLAQLRSSPAATPLGVAATEMAPAAWAAEVARSAAGRATADGDRSATYRALAWSQEAASGELPVPAVEDEFDVGDPGAAAVVPAAPPVAPRARRRRWYRRWGVLLSAIGAAALVLLVAGGLAVRLSGTGDKPTDNVHGVTPPVESSRLEPPPPPTTTVEPPNSGPAEAPPPTTVVTTHPPVTTTPPTTTPPTTTPPTTTPPTSTYATSTYPTSTYPTTTYPTTTVPSGASPPSRYPTTYPSTPYPGVPYPSGRNAGPALPSYPAGVPPS
ncbi:hypothetical protein A5660_00980 [Mycobacterium alsense]|uniref:Hsp70 family protein n=1 Tax=Mycobacterium alsense TaxID=324058 RepID=UPI0008009474|nr:Hsp70 family protein [Mycobacterium alsense]OBI95053.1 hypothetical protein A5660_00980 [Mycobacterium alsense]